MAWRCIVLMTGLSASGLVWAQTGGPDPAAEDSAQLPEISVTAERAVGNLRTTPLSVGVIDARAIESRGLYQLNDMVGVIAGVTVPNGFSNMPQAVGIRGVGVSIPAMSQAVGIYVDDVPLIRGYATALWDLPDIERIEVLRGPQGTLYGQNSTAGAIRIVSVDPSADKSAWIAAAAGNHGALETRGYATGAIGDGPLAGSIAFSRRTNDGFGYNATKQENVNKLDATQFRAKLKAAPTSDLTVVLAIDGLRDRSDTNTTNYPLNTPNAAPRVTYTAAADDAFKRDAGGVSLKVDYALANGTSLRSITAYRGWRDNPTVADFGGLVVQRYGISQDVEQKALSQELQWSGKSNALSWTTGIIGVRDHFDFDRFVTSFPLAAASPSYTQAQTALRTSDLGVYGQARYALNDTTGLTGGLRAYRTRQTGSNSYWRTTAAQSRTTAVYVAPDLSTSKTGLLPRIGIDHLLTPDDFVYASLAQGAKFGGFNRAAESLLAAQVATQPERVTTYEFGLKSRLDRGGVTANIAFFYNDYKNYLASLNNSVVNGVQVTDAVLVNAGKAKTYGVDLELAARLGARTDASLSLEVLRSRFLQFQNPTGAAGANYVGNRLPFAPELTLGMNIVHREPLRDGSTLALDASVRHLAGQFSDVANSPLLRVPRQTYVDLGASLFKAGTGWAFSVRVRNLFGKDYVLLRSRIPPLGLDTAFYSAPRTVLLTARYDL